jgi:hypothetical protein
MQGTIAQIVALTVHGNCILQKGLDVAGGEFQAQNTTFKFCESVNFVDGTSGAPPVNLAVYATDVQGWFQRLHDEGIRGLRMSYGPSSQQDVPDRKLAGFVGGGGEWLIEARGRSKSDFWQSRWQIGNRNRLDKKIWRVSYFRVLGGTPSTPAKAEALEPLLLGLKQCLEEIGQFARSQQLAGFADAFESGIAILESPDPLAGVYHRDLAPPGFLSLSARRLLAAAQQAWVFGGMGSWNDLGFQGPTQALYDRLSEQLYQLLNRAVVSAVNSSAA